MDAAPHVRQQRILAGLPPDAQVLLVGFSETRALQTLSHASLVIVDRREITVGRHFIQKQRQSFTSALNAPVEFRIGFRKGARLYVRMSQIEAADPGIKNVIRLREELDGGVAVAIV